jgi:DMSO/TMAO reductase YedYZ heme-binding membrane subunit
MTNNQRNWTVFIAAAGLTAVASILLLNAAGYGDDNIRFLLRISARIAFLLLLFVFMARPLRQLIKTPGTLSLLKNRRLLGVGFAGVHTAHLALIFYRVHQVPAFEFDWLARLPGIATYLVMYLMLITSFDRPARAIGAKRWKTLHKIGLYWLFIAFAQREIPRSFDNLETANGWLLIFITVALAIRLTAFLGSRRAKGQPQ